jgi:hypothetical protein
MEGEPRGNGRDCRRPCEGEDRLCRARSALAEFGSSSSARRQSEATWRERPGRPVRSAMKGIVEHAHLRQLGHLDSLLVRAIRNVGHYEGRRAAWRLHGRRLALDAVLDASQLPSSASRRAPARLVHVRRPGQCDVRWVAERRPRRRVARTESDVSRREGTRAGHVSKEERGRSEAVSFSADVGDRPGDC